MASVIVELDDHVVDNRLSPTGVCSVLYSSFFSLKKGQHMSVFQSGVGLKSSQFKKKDMINFLLHTFKYTSEGFTSVAPNQDFIALSERSEGNCIVGAITPVQVVRPSWISPKRLK